MKHHTWRLIKIQLLDISGLNQSRYGKGRQSRLKPIFTVALITALALLFAFYGVMMTVGYIQMGMGEIVPPLMYALASIAVLFTSIYKTSGLIFGARDFDLLQSLPIATADIILSRFISLYLLNLGFCACIMLPSGILSGIHMGAGIIYYPQLLLMWLLTPVIPLIIATIIGTLLMAISSRFRHKNLMMIILGVVASCGILILSFQMPSMDMTKFSSFNEMLLSMIYGLFPLARLFYGALYEQQILMFIAFILINIILYAIFMQIMVRCHKKINTAVTTHHQRSDYQVRTLATSSASMALYKKELRRYFSSPIYVLNTAIGPAMMLLLAIAVVLGYADQFFIMPQMTQALPFALGFCVVMNATTASSISLEGQSFWQLLVLPVRPAQIYQSKRLITFTLGLPAVIISVILIALKQNLTPLQNIFLLLVPLSYLWLTSEAGLYLNLRFPNFNWKTETAVVKQSVPTMICIFGGMILSMAPFYLSMMAPTAETLLLIYLGFSVLAAVLALVCHYLTNRVVLNHIEG